MHTALSILTRQNALERPFWEGKTAAEYTFKRNSQAGHQVCSQDWWRSGVDWPTAKASDNLKDFFKFELCSYPPALFDSSYSFENHCHLGPSDTWNSWHKWWGAVCFIWWALVQRIPWTRGATHFRCSEVPQPACILPDTAMERLWGWASTSRVGLEGKWSRTDANTNWLASSSRWALAGY